MNMEELHDMERTGLPGKNLVQLAKEDEDEDHRLGSTYQLARNLPKPPSAYPQRVFKPIVQSESEDESDSEDEQEIAVKIAVKC
jgi:hypothetical protein